MAWSRKPAGLVDGPVTMVATIMFMTMPPMVLPVATTLKTVPSECFGTRSTTSELMLISQASEATTAQAARVMAKFRPVTWEMNGESGIRQAQPNMTHRRLRAGAMPRFTSTAGKPAAEQAADAGRGIDDPGDLELLLARGGGRC